MYLFLNSIFKVNTKAIYVVLWNKHVHHFNPPNPSWEKHEIAFTKTICFSTNCWYASSTFPPSFSHRMSILAFNHLIKCRFPLDLCLKEDIYGLLGIYSYFECKSVLNPMRMLYFLITIQINWIFIFELRYKRWPKNIG